MRPNLVRLKINDGIATLTISNPPLNIITADVRAAIETCLSEVRDAKHVRVLVITGDGDRSFCAGADLEEEAELTPETVRRFIEEDNAVYDGVESLPIPVVAAINGHCMGGGLELALACDIRIASATAKFCAPGVKLGLVVSTTRLTRLLGPARAKDLVLTGRTFLGEEAERIGLVARSVPPGDVRAEASMWAEMIASRAPLAVARAKTAIREAAELDYAEAFSRELDHFADMTSTNDHKRAVEAFFRREEPIFDAT